jgi:ABC-type lipoprotein release transport system permease subunit
VGGVLLGAALLASWLPARRATTVSPAEVLRGD